ncbi:hypothetical protein [Arthrobacter globiformis]|uniref:hypothetical protein n=1 Tax=Arthrobacter globiformis TaxID=1665 RepID=UPI0027D84A61|nr:hypothetical protein [Arthrobacter globiformis]
MEERAVSVMGHNAGGNASPSGTIGQPVGIRLHKFPTGYASHVVLQQNRHG